MKVSITMGEAISAFENHLKGNAKLPTIANFWHGFEGWLKFELAGHLCGTPWDCIPWKMYNGTWCAEDIGLEYRWKNEEPERGVGQKLIDFWVRARPQKKPCHYFELKTVFNNKNAAKQIWSWLSDFDVLRQINPDGGVEGFASIIFAVGWADRGTWETTVKTVLGSNFPSKNDNGAVELVAPSTVRDGVIMHALVGP